MSPMSSAREAPRRTARAWWSISSMVTDRVSGWPRTTMARESPTRIASTPAWSARRAVGKSYAVTIVIGSRRSRFSRKVRVVVFRGVADDGPVLIASSPRRRSGRPMRVGCAKLWIGDRPRARPGPRRDPGEGQDRQVRRPPRSPPDGVGGCRNRSTSRRTSQCAAGVKIPAMDRRGFAKALTAGIGLASWWPRATVAAPSAGALTDVGGVKVGHFTDTRRPTGCTVVLVEAGATCGVDVRGGAPGTRETDLLDPVNMVPQVHAVVLSGGSAFGLDTASGVMRWLEERKIGFPVGPARVPIVPAAILFDLNVGDATIRPDAAAGYAAAAGATSAAVAEGNVGAGAGATVGKMLGFARAMKAGLGTASVKLPSGAVVG